MRKKGFLFFFLLMAAASPLLCASCKGRGLAVIGVEPHVVYDCSGGETGKGSPYLFVFVRTEGCDEARSIALSCPDASLSWLDFSPVRGDEGLFYAVFSPAPSMPFPKSQYVLTLSDYYGGSAGISFSLSYDEGMSDVNGGGAEAVYRSAYFRKDGRLEIFGEMDKDRDTLKSKKNITGRKPFCVSRDGGTVGLLPYEDIH